MRSAVGADPEAGASGRRQLQHGAVRGQNRMHERRDAVDGQLRLERHPTARLRQGALNTTYGRRIATAAITIRVGDEGLEPPTSTV